MIDARLFTVLVTPEHGGARAAHDLTMTARMLATRFGPDRMEALLEGHTVAMAGSYYRITGDTMGNVSAVDV